MSTPDTINVYRLYDPIELKLLQLDIEQAAVDTGDFTPGYVDLTIYDNGFWTLRNDLDPYQPTPPLPKGIDQAREIAEKWMTKFDESLSGMAKYNRQNSEDYQNYLKSIHPMYHPPTLPKPKKNSKPQFFENSIYLGGRGMQIELRKQTHTYYRLIYGIQLKPSDQEDPVMVEDVEIVIEVWDDGAVRRVECKNLPIAKVEEDKRLHSTIIGFLMDMELGYIFPFSEIELSYGNN